MFNSNSHRAADARHIVTNRRAGIVLRLMREGCKRLRCAPNLTRTLTFGGCHYSELTCLRLPPITVVASSEWCASCDPELYALSGDCKLWHTYARPRSLTTISGFADGASREALCWREWCLSGFIMGIRRSERCQSWRTAPHRWSSFSFDREMLTLLGRGTALILCQEGLNVCASIDSERFL